MAERKYGRKKKSGSNKELHAKSEQISNKVEEIVSIADYKTDPLGSYTGIPEQPGEVPTQDADDL